MSSIDSLSEIVLGNVKLPAEDEQHIVPFLRRIQDAYGLPLALVHDMGKGILKAVATVFPEVGPTCRVGLWRNPLCLNESHPADATHQSAAG